MLATAMKGINEKFDTMEKAIEVLVEQQKTNEKKLDELMASKVFKSKVIVIIKDFNFRATVKPVDYEKDIQPVTAGRQHLLCYNLPSVKSSILPCNKIKQSHAFFLANAEAFFIRVSLMTVFTVEFVFNNLPSVCV